jgi:hypothetical protein
MVRKVKCSNTVLVRSYETNEKFPETLSKGIMDKSPQSKMGKTRITTYEVIGLPNR